MLLILKYRHQDIKEKGKKTRTVLHLQKGFLRDTVEGRTLPCRIEYRVKGKLKADSLGNKTE